MIKIGLWVLTIISIVNFAFAAEEQLTITTYYPSPYGSYNELSTNKLKIGTSASSPYNQGIVNFGGISLDSTNLPHSSGHSGDLTYNNTPRNQDVGGRAFYYHDGSSWQKLGGVTASWVSVQGVSTDYALCGLNPSGTNGCPEGYLVWNHEVVAVGGVNYDATPEGICKAAGYNYYAGVGKFNDAVINTHHYTGNINSLDNDYDTDWCNGQPCWYSSGGHSGHLGNSLQLLCVK